jgi:ribosome-associated translation inhibitor RaiA
MDVQVHTNHLLIRDEGVQLVVARALERVADRLITVEVYLRDTTVQEGGIDKHCLLVVRPRGLDSVVARHQAASSMEAVTGAADKLERKLEHLLGGIGDR